MHSSQPNGMFTRGSSNSPVGSREQPRGQSDYSTWKNRQLDTTASYQGSAMDIDYPPAAPAVPANTVYTTSPYQGGQGYPQPPYPPPAHPAAPYPPQPSYGYPTNPPTQYSPGPQAHPDRYPGMVAPPPVPQGYGQDATYVQGSNYQSATAYGTAGPNRMTPLSAMSSAPPSRTFGAVAGAPGYGEPDPYGYNTGNMASQSYPVDPAYGRQGAPGGQYSATATNPPPQAPSDDLGSPAGTAPPRQPFGTGPEPQFDERRSPGVPNAPTPTNGTPSQVPATGPPPPRRDAEPRERERDRDHREHRPRRSETDDRHAAERARQRHGHR